MATELATTAATGSASGSLASIGTSLANLGSTSKAYLLLHPSVGGFLLGAGVVYGLGKVLAKRRQEKELPSVPA